MVKILGRFYTCCVFCLLDSWWRGSTAVKWQLVYSVTERLSAFEDVFGNHCCSLRFTSLNHVAMVYLQGPTSQKNTEMIWSSSPRWNFRSCTRFDSRLQLDTMLLYWTDWQLQPVVPNSELDCSTVARRWSPIRWYDDSDRVVIAATTRLSSHVVLYLRRAGPEDPYRKGCRSESN